ncbi:acetate--CoA ligase family protein [Nonomuraea sp. C10]|uniref:acetate--CoA ligase family protein n=1 Tax=Nonomuraea sp. C10 TaxID=2600577 RepID=UPI00164FC63A|nr:acetate--CoA ligase family protein [Nonomuraea sp. C10]
MITVTGAEPAVQTLFNPRSVAVIGASSKPGTLSWWPLRLLVQYGFAGGVHPVNPSRSEIEGVPCVASLADVGGPVDLAVIALNAKNTVQAVRDCAAAGVKVAVLPSQGFGETGEDGRAMEREMLAAARESGLRIVGPNTDGVGNLATGALATIQPIFGQGVEPGRVAVITQSGATAASLIMRLKEEGIGTRLYASAGNEIDLGLADYLSVALQDPEVSMVVSFVEAIRRPDDFVKVAELAAELGKPIVLIKVGRTEQAARRAAAHTGALAGADEIYQAVFDSLGIIRVDELSEVVAVAKFYLSRGLPQDDGVAIMSVSGGQAGALADRAARSGVTVPDLGPAATAELEELLAFGTAINPCDLTGEVARDSGLATAAYTAFDADPSVSTVVYARKELTGDAGRRASERIAAAAAPKERTPLAIYSMDGEPNDEEKAAFAEADIPVFTSAGELFTAVRTLAAYRRGAERARTRKTGPAARTGESGGAGTVPAIRIGESGGAGTGPAARTGESGQAASRALPGGAGPLDEAAAKALLAEYGVAVPAEALATSADDAVAHAERIGYPVVLKVADARVPHKTEIGGVEVGLAGAAAVRAAYEGIDARARAHLGDAPEGVLVQQQITDGVEMIAGIVVDPQFGPFVLLGSGGVLTELLSDAVLRPAPVEPGEVRDMIAELRGRKLLTGFRGAPPADVDALADTVSALSRLGADHADRIAELDLNPVLVRPAGHGAVAVDALIVLGETEESR